MKMMARFGCKDREKDFFQINEDIKVNNSLDQYIYDANLNDAIET